MNLKAPELRRTWLFGPGAHRPTHEAMARSGADGFILDLEDFTPPELRAQARQGLAEVAHMWRELGALVCVRINQLDTEGPQDLEAAMRCHAQVISYPMAKSAAQMAQLDEAITAWEQRLNLAVGSTEIMPVCETALGVVAVREMAAASTRVRSALLGAEDLANDLCAEREPDAVELDYARRRFVLECRAASLEPIDAPFTYGDVQGAVNEGVYARRLGYRSKSLVRPEHAQPLNEVFTPSAQALARAQGLVMAFDQARARGEDRALFEGQWVEVPTYRNARRLIERAQQLQSSAIN